MSKQLNHKTDNSHSEASRAEDLKAQISQTQISKAQSSNAHNNQTHNKQAHNKQNQSAELNAQASSKHEPNDALMANEMEQTSLVIVGGGHVGLSLALLLAHKGIQSTLLEKNSYPQISPDADKERSHYLDSRNTALSRRTVQIYQEIGLWQQLDSHACRIDEVHISELGSFGKAKLKKEEEGVESFGYVMENAWLGRELLLAAKDNPLIKVIDGVTVVDVKQDYASNVQQAKNKGAKQQLPQAVTVSYQQSAPLQVAGKQSSKVNTICAELLVACDGRDSLIRKLLGIKTKEHDYKQSAIVGVVTTDKAHEHVGIERFSAVGPLAVLPLTSVEFDDQNDKGQTANEQSRQSVVWICPEGEEQRYLEDDAYFLDTLQTTFGKQAGTFLQAGRRGVYPLSKVLAKRQVQGRCVIMGNAAHTLHPVAGQGFNLCMRDADALTKLLAAQLVDSETLVTVDLLNLYESSRQKDQKRVIRFCDAVVYGFSHPNKLIKFSRNLGLLMFDKVPNVKPLVATYAMGLKS